METTNDVKKFLNQMQVFKILTGIEYNTFKIIRKILTDEFENDDVDKLVEVIKNLDDLYIEYLKMNVYFEKTLVSTLRDKIFDIYKQKLDRNDSDQQLNKICDRINGCKNKRIL